jgi:general nucleoside transport system permease protein
MTVAAAPSTGQSAPRPAPGGDAPVGRPGHPVRAAARTAVRWLGRWRRLWIALGVYAACLAVYGMVVALRGANPVHVIWTMIDSTVLASGSLQQAVLRAVPLVLAALAVSVPARAGLVNVGGEGQLIMGAVVATGVGVAIGASVPGPVSWLAMGVGAMVAGGIWAGISGVLRTGLGANEAVTTLLMNFVANDIMLFLIYQPWKDPHSSGQPESNPLAQAARLPLLLGTQLDLGVIITVVVAVGVWLLLRRTGWGFALRIVGGNQEAARRAGLPVKRLMVSSMLVGGALAGLGGMLNLAGLEFQLRPDITLTFGYVAFLASWLGRHDPPKVVAAAFLFSLIAVSGNGIQLTYGLDGSVVDILLGLIVMAPLILTRGRAEGY